MMNAHSTGADVPSRAARAQEAQERVHELLHRSATDPGFRAKLVNDPRAALAEFTGREVASTLNVRFIENQGGYPTVVLPDSLESETPLSVEELESVAGGSTAACIATIVLLLALYDACA
jgi:hypothetical protein